MKKFLLFLCGMALVFGMVGSVNANIITNGDFETGNLFPWNATPNVVVTDTLWGVSAYEGDYMAVMSPLGILDADLWQNLPGFAPGTDVAVSFAYKIGGLDWLLFGDPGTDYLEVTADGFTLLHVNLNDAFDWGGGTTELEWTVFSQTYSIDTLTGPLAFNFHLENFGEGDEGQNTVAYIDAVSVSVPEPASMLLLGTGLIGLAGLGRKKFVKKS